MEQNNFIVWVNEIGEPLGMEHLSEQHGIMNVTILVKHKYWKQGVTENRNEVIMCLEQQSDVNNFICCISIAWRNMYSSSSELKYVFQNWYTMKVMYST
jgi:hypothetical protein